MYTMVQNRNALWYTDETSSGSELTVAVPCTIMCMRHLPNRSRQGDKGCDPCQRAIRTVETKETRVTMLLSLITLCSVVFFLSDARWVEKKNCMYPHGVGGLITF
jgi:hypothetical protein